MRLLCVLITLLLLATTECHADRTVAGIVRAVYDGDTILLISGSSRLKIRLYGIDAPETAKPDKAGQPFGEAAKRALTSKILGKRVIAEVVDMDQYQRAMAVIRYAGRDINREMVGEGMAWAYRYYLQGPYASEYLAAENRARARRGGLWQDTNPQPPWEFRRMQKGGGRHYKRH